MSGSAAKAVGLWIDHRKAVVVTVGNDSVEVRTIESGAEGRIRLSGGARSATPYGPQDVACERSWQDRRRHHLATYYRRVLRAVRGARAIFIFGPAEAKLELERMLLKSKGLGSKLVGVETTDKMTENHIVARVREVFAAHERSCHVFREDETHESERRSKEGQGRRRRCGQDEES